MTTLKRPRTVFPINCSGACRNPVDGRLELQLESGEATTTLQEDRILVRRKLRGFSTMLNPPNPFVMADAITLPPHVTWTRASACQSQNKKHT